MIKSTILWVTLASLLISGQAGAVELPDTASVRTDRLQLRQAIHPTADKLISQASFMLPYPIPRLSFRHAWEFFPSCRVARGNEGVYVLPRAEGQEQRIAGLTFTGPEG